MPEIHNVFILKDGIPVFHINPVGKLLQNDQEVESKTKNMDSALIAGFLSAIASFANEIGIGTPKTYETNDMKFSFLSKNNLLFILGTTNLEENEIQIILKEIVDEFVGMLSRDNLDIMTSNLSPFNGILKEILTGYVEKFDLLEESQFVEKFDRLIPCSHIIPKTLEKLSDTRRMLFKLVDGSNSIYEIAKVTKQHPRLLLSILRSYSKSGIVSFQEQDFSKVRELNL